MPGIGPITLASDCPRLEQTPYEFRECQDQPEGSAVQIEQYGEGVTLTVPPAGIRHGSKGLFAFGLIWSVVITAAGLFMIGSMRNAGTYHIGAIAGLAFLVLVGLAMLAGAVQMGRRRAVLAVVGPLFMVLQVGPFGRQRRQWQVNQIRDIRTGPGRMSSAGEPVIELQVLPTGGKMVRLLGGRDEEELRWLATVLRQGLRREAGTVS